MYCADHTYCTLRLPMDTSVEQILSSARDKLCLGDDLVLCEVKSTGGKNYTSQLLPMDTSVEQILSSARDKLCLCDDLVLCEVKSTGG